ncbi:MAG: hypothetical protein ACREF1_16540 [Acetobacteraceae bacterium]
MAGATAVSDLAIKLHLAAAALGCHGRKELCVRFRNVNPDTHFDLERSHKWLQGRATPRYPHVYDDWARVLGSDRPGAWLASCSMDAFLAEVCALHGSDPAALLRRAQSQMPPTRDVTQRKDAFDLYLRGTYVCYSLAWSPYYPGHMIGGELTLGPDQTRSALTAIYTEALLARVARFDGELLLAGRMLHVLVRESTAGSPLFMSLFLPGPPASVLCGVMSGTAVVGPEARPSATRMVAVRVPRSGGVSSGYFLPTAGAISADLLAHGLPLVDPDGVDALIRSVLASQTPGGADQVPASEQAQLAAALDRSYLQGARPA